MKDYSIFSSLKGKLVNPPLLQKEKEEIWFSIKEKLYERKGKKFPYKFLAIAAILILSFSVGFLIRSKIEKEKEVLISQNFIAPPMIEVWEGNADMIYETQTQDIKLAFVVDSNIKW